MTAPLISIIIPCYNYADCLERVAVSALTQPGGDFDLWIIDDGSTDATAAVAAALQARWPGRCHYQRQPNAGPAAARNRGLSMSRGQWLLFLDADDELLPDALHTFRTAIRDNPQAAVILTEHISLSASGRHKHHRQKHLPLSPQQRLRAYLLDKTLDMCHGALLLHRDAFADYRYPEHFRGGEDQPLFAFVLTHFPCALITKPTARIHHHAASLRNRAPLAASTGLQLVDEIFDPARMPADFMSLKSAYMARRHLSLFRTLVQIGQRRAAWQHYAAALRLWPGAAMHPRYWGKLLRISLTGCLRRDS